MEVVEDDSVWWDGLDESALAALEQQQQRSPQQQPGGDADGGGEAELRAQLDAAHRKIEELSLRLQPPPLCWF